MNGIELTFDAHYFEKRLNLIWRAPHVREAVERAVSHNMGPLLMPMSLIDVGCSVGEFVQEFRDNCWTAIGLDGSEAVRPHFLANPEADLVIADLRKSLKSQLQKIDFPYGSFDVALCFEVGGVGLFNSRTAKRSLVKNLKFLTHKFLFFAVAEDLQWEWNELFAEAGFHYEADRVEKFREVLEPWKRKMAMKAIYYGTRVWIRGD